ncbi:MAG: radical SAM protein [Kiritimatiellia bacterium]
MNNSAFSIQHSGLKNCTLCPRECGIDRTKGWTGYCRAGMMPRVFRYGPHFGEEPPITGRTGSGAVFFSHCTLRCIYCQNHPWSQTGRGEDLSITQLSGIFERLYDQGCHNWNLVSPTPWLPRIREAVLPLIHAGKSLPFVYNTSGFESEKTLEEYKELINIALIDLRYASEKSALEGSDAADYVKHARKAFKCFWKLLGPLEQDADGTALRGVICRILALPGRIDEAIANLEWIAANIGSDVHISVMSQYTPAHKALNREGWNSRVQRREYEKLTEAVTDLGFNKGWIQKFEKERPAGFMGQDMPSGEGSIGQG